MRPTWDPNPAFTTIPVWKPDATPEYLERCQQRMQELYAEYAASLDDRHPLWHFEILTVRQPPHELAELAQQRRNRSES